MEEEVVVEEVVEGEVEWGVEVDLKNEKWMEVEVEK